MTGSIVWLAAPERDALDVALGEIDSAIALVVSGAVRSVRLVGVVAATEAAPLGAARAHAAAVAFRISPGSADLPVFQIGRQVALTQVPE